MSGKSTTQTVQKDLEIKTRHVTALTRDREDLEKRDLVRLAESWYCDTEREYLYQKMEVGEEEVGAKTKTGVTLTRKRFAYDRVDDLGCGMPRVLQVFKQEHEHKDYDDETFYTIEWSHYPVKRTGTFSVKQINSGECWSHWPGLRITGKRDINFYADIVKAQVLPFHIPETVVYRETGWHQGEDGKWFYVFRDGRLLTANGIEDREIPLIGYDFTKTQHYQAWKTTDIQQPLSQEQIQQFLSWMMDVDKDGRLILLCCGAYRSLIHTFVPLSVSVMVAAADDVDTLDGSTGAGKTSCIDFARGVDGPCPYRSEPDVSFRGTLAGKEVRIAHIQDLPISVADFHLVDSPTEAAQEKLATTTDYLLSAATDNTEIKERSTKTLEPRKGTSVKGLLIMDGEKVYPMLMSRWRRLVFLPFRRGEINTDRLHEEWARQQSVHYRIGHALLHYVVQTIHDHEILFVQEIRDQELRYEKQLFDRFTQDHPEFDRQLARSLAQNYSRFITGAWLAEHITGMNGLVPLSFDAAYRYLCGQFRLFELGGPLTVTKRWILVKTRRALENGMAYAAGMDGDYLSPNSPGIAEDVKELHRWGYRLTSMEKQPWQPHGERLLNLSDDGEMCYFRLDVWYDLLKKMARQENLKWPYTLNHFGRVLVDMGIVVPGKDQSTSVVRIARKPERRLVVPAELLEIDRDPGEGDKEEARSEKGEDGKLHVRSNGHYNSTIDLGDLLD